MQNLKINTRNISKQKLNTTVIVLSLIVGFVCVNLISLFIQRELSTDAFHVNKDQIFALHSDDPWEPGQKMFYTRYGSAEYMKQNFAGVEDFCRLKRQKAIRVTVNNNVYFDEPKTISVSSNFFEFFSYNLLSNNAKTVLQTSECIVISEQLEKKYFGKGSALGQIIKIEDRFKKREFVVSGIFKKTKENSQIDFDIVYKIGEDNSSCYVRLNANTTKYEIEKLFAENTENIPFVHGAKHTPYELTALQDRYFVTPQFSEIEPRRDKSDLWIALSIGLIILAVGLSNYLGLVNNKLYIKKKEYSIRLINGSSKYSLISNFVVESFVIVIASYIVSVFVLLWVAPFFNTLVNTNVSLQLLLEINGLLLSLAPVLFTMLLTIVFSSIKILCNSETNLKNLTNTPKARVGYLPYFNIFQIAASIILIVASITIIKQMQFIMNKPIGVNKNVIQVKIPFQFKEKTTLFKDKLLKSPNIENVTESKSSPLLQHWLIMLNYNNGNKSMSYSPAGFEGDENFIKTLDINLLEGKDFSKNSTANKNKVIINKALANLFPDINLVGKGLPGNETNEVIGIVDDFHYSSLLNKVQPAFISYNEKGEYLLVKSKELLKAEAVKIIAKVWNELIPNFPLEIELLADRFEWLHRKNKNYVKLITACSCISLFLSMIGLFAISVKTSRRRIKEIGIRKVNGAKALEIMQLLNKEFMKLIIISFIIACPIAVFFMQKWLDGFAYKTPLSWWVFALAILVAVSLSIFTVTWQSLKVALKNPVEALRYE